MKREYCRGWQQESGEHITKFRQRLGEEQQLWVVGLIK